MSKKTTLTLTLLSLIVFLGPFQSHAEKGVKPITAQCTLRVAKTMDVPFAALVMILNMEDGYVGLKQYAPTSDTYDYGPAQVNSFWLKELSKFGISEHQLQYDGCMNINAAAYIFKLALNETHNDLIKAIGLYHSRSPELQKTYQKKFIDRLKIIKHKTDVHKVFKRVNRSE